MASFACAIAWFGSFFFSRDARRPCLVVARDTYTSPPRRARERTHAASSQRRKRAPHVITCAALLFRQLAYLIWLREGIARLASNLATLKMLLRGRVTERVPRWDAATCRFWALRTVDGCAELERLLKQRGALVKLNAVCMPPGQVGGRVGGRVGGVASNQPGALINPARALERDAAAVAAGYDPPARVVVDGQMQRTTAPERGYASNQSGAVLDPAAALARDAAAVALGREPTARVFVGGQMQRTTASERGYASNQSGAVMNPAAALARDDASRAAGRVPPARVVVDGQMQRTIGALSSAARAWLMFNDDAI